MNVHTTERWPEALRRDLRATKRARVIMALGVSLVAILAAAPASADPSGAPQYRQLAGVGSDTTEGVMNAIANNVTIGGTKVLGSYDANGSAQVTTKDPATTPGCTINRPNGSGAGRTALLTSLQANGGAGNGCLQYARSSSLTLTASTPSITYVPFAVDAVTFAITGDSAIPRNLTLDELKSIYKCEIGGITPVLPQAGSGTRSFWLGIIGITDAQVNSGVYPCIVNGTLSGQPIQEHDGRVLTGSSLVPFSIAQYVAQASGTLTDIRGRAVLGVINGITPLTMNTSVPLTRNVYNVIPTSQIGNAPYSTVFVGSGSLICQQSAIIQQYGFAPNPNCGDTSAHS
ncbi:hypothetical protein F4553_003293 [Allocatelliglobosispora scoriae]|uniref:PBP domain-containing protein n=1 Tax=Allocatelliglobosispora scoriae TaxID=643052 RepID=A0A841BNR6_9ACTN|nr:substrate-binding domain-containing protein [Allocatelliglobosispora scoriae]MBB5869914.1 hypothetical protein [Allocatelliglobosispora scoriae]